MIMKVSGEVAHIINTVISLAKNAHFEYVTPELVLYVVCQNTMFVQAFENCGGKIKELDSNLRSYLDRYMEVKEKDFEKAEELIEKMIDRTQKGIEDS